MTTTPASRTLAWLRQFAKLWGFALFCVLVVYIFREVVAPVPVRDPGRVHPGAAGRARAGRCAIGGRPFPRAAAVIILYVIILAALGLFIGYFVPKLSGDFARLFREAPQLFAKRQQGLAAAGRRLDRHALRRPRRGGEPGRRRHAAPAGAAGAARDRGRAAGRRALPHRPRRGQRSRCGRSTDGKYLIAPPALGRGRRRRRAASGSGRSSSGSPTRLKSTEGESRRVARVRPEVHRRRRVRASAGCSWC